VWRQYYLRSTGEVCKHFFGDCHLWFADFKFIIVGNRIGAEKPGCSFLIHDYSFEAYFHRMGFRDIEVYEN
jgi:hypothetical protein